MFWTFLALTAGLTAYALAVESLGIGLFLRDQHVPKLHMRAEARLASTVASVSAIGLAMTCSLIGRRSRSLRRLGFAAIAFWLFYLAIPRF